ncbi:hypothetical protein BK007_00045 [Methanobacterium subterraneum]|jgi:hypothetical protein|uniref:DUF1795 domain-containing protein n=1 Tax=Methanobacterium subterraneum TaxID=59277 RepID=A0A2H4V903_9EURY|nr:PsbP-related protein [Methanobacterium subterraneum]AUB54572.1 hypothetical protein BK007_00045 [Methanobacterium subterraneum]PKL73000.1 MAG: hypothetical protein CVV29_05815 [Methanobacteriales archaeon HGW-Methanobacteriales-2]
MLPRIISSMGLVFLIFSVVVVSGCTSDNELDNVYKTESDGLKHFASDGISFDSPNNWTYYKMDNNEGDYLFSIGLGNCEERDFIHFHAGKYDRTLSEHISSEKKEIPLRKWTMLSEKELTVGGLPAYQISALNQENKPLIKTWFIQNGTMYTIHAVPGPDKNLTSIEKDLEIVISSFKII